MKKELSGVRTASAETCIGAGGQSEWKRESERKKANWEGGDHGSHIEPRIFNPQCDGEIVGVTV